MPAKVALKKSITRRQQGRCALSKKKLPKVVSLVDTDRIVPKAESGTYTKKNTRVVDPVAHMKRHGTYRERGEDHTRLKGMFDDRVQMMKLLLKENNQILAYQRRTDSVNPDTVAFLTAHVEPIRTRLKEIDKALAKEIAKFPDPLAQAALAVPGLGPITVAALTTYVDIEKAATPSALWKYVGLDCASGDRYTKGVAGGGNKTLRTVLWNAANVMMKLGDRSAYREVYDRTKERLSRSERIVKSRNTQGKLVEVPWMDTKPSHRHGAALRAIIKHLLADYWYVGRTLAGLNTVPLYVVEKLGHTHIVRPEERGWNF